MKRFFLLLMMAMAVVGCTDEGPDDGDSTGGSSTQPQTTITLTTTALNFTTEGGSQTVTFSSTGEWTAQVLNDRANDWCKVAPASGAAGNGQIAVTVAANGTTDERSASVILKSGTVQKTIKVTQKPKDALTVTASKFEVAFEGGTVAIEVKANIDFSYAVDGAAQSWIKYQTTRAMKTSTLVFDIAENDERTTRQGTITISSGSLKEVVTIYQEGSKPAIVISQSEYVVSSAGGSVAVEVKSNVDVSVELPSDAEWLTENTTRAMSTNTYYFDVAENTGYDQRSATIVFTNKANNLTEEVTITQTQKDAIVLAKGEYEIDVDGGALDFEIQTNVDVTVKTSATWIKQVTTRGLESKMLFFDIAANNAEEDREGTITISGGKATQTITVKQKGTQGILDAERQALIDLYNATNGAQWEKNTNWCSDKPVSEWNGVTCSSNGRVTRIHLNTNNLVGELPESIGNLTALTYIELGNNKLTGSIPESIGNLISLTYLGLPYNQFTGSIPESIGNLKSLTDYLGLHYNKLTGSIPESIGNLTSLESLRLYNNQLTGDIPASIGNMTALKSLLLSGNKFAGSIPEWISYMTSLEELNLGDNQFTGSIPESIGNITTLKELRLGNNQLTGSIPASICKMTNLQYLYLSNNQLSGSIPESIGNLIALKDLRLENNQLTGSIPASIGNLTSLTGLLIANNQLTGSIPESIGNLTKLESIYLYENQLSGSIPQSIGNLSQLKMLHLYTNQLTGPIPESIGNLTAMKRLQLGNNQLTGPIPESIGNLTAMERLWLENNQLTSIPEGLANCSSLKTINLRYNRLSGGVPESVMQASWWSHSWGNIIYGNNIEKNEVKIPGPQFSTKDIDGNPITSAIYAENEYTILFQFYYDCIYAYRFAPELVEIYNTYKDKGVGAFSISSTGTASDAATFAQNNSIPWPIIYSTGAVNYNEYFAVYTWWSPIVSVIDKNGMVVFNHLYDERTELADFFADKFGEEVEVYESTDYSQDGVVTTLQTATKGAGIDVVLMGDAYSDRLIADGTYDKTMNAAMEKFFAVEPYKSYRDHFNVYSVKAVSKNEGYGDGYETIFSGEFGEGTHVGGDHSKVIEYGLKAISDERMDEAMLVVMMNSTAYAGTCYMYQPSVEGDYGCGLSVSYFPVGTDDTALGQVLNHETNGHGFSKLADEYAYEANGVIPYENVTDAQTMQNSYGWWKNVDFVSSTTAIRWAKFISDTRYANENLGAYEGAMTYWTGVWRPTENSIMRYNTGGFNAPSREAIYYRINKLAYGSDWTYDYETFVEYDEINRTVTTTTQSAPMIYKPTTPPVVMNKNWRDEVR